MFGHPLPTTWASVARGLSAAIAALLAFKAHGLTPADVVGPDGIVYPDWRQAGVPNGIPQNQTNEVWVTDHGAHPDDNDDNDDTPGFQTAADLVAAAGGGVVRIPAGTFHLKKPVLVYGNKVVFRGAGADATKLYFDYAPPDDGVAFYRPGNQGTIRANSWVEVHADPVGLETLELKYNGTALASVSTKTPEMKPMRGAIYSVRTKGSVIVTAADGANTATLTAEAKYEGRSAAEITTITVNIDDGPDPEHYIVPEMLGAITFLGRGTIGDQFELAASATRGSTTLTLQPGHTVAAQDRVLLVAPTTANWRAQVGNACTTDMFRHYMFRVESVSGNTIELNQPLRIDYPLDSQGDPYIQKLVPIEGCGVEDLYLEQTKNVWTSGVIFSWAWKCWAKGVTVKKAGRHPIYFLPAKWCEIRDCSFEDAWWKGPGGSAYVGWERAYDCLMDNVTASHMRHAPLFQWTSAGSVIRNSRFYNSDAQWHSGWTNENLFELCVIESNHGNAGYGKGMWSSAPESTSHGPNGPRNVVYNNDVTSAEGSVYLGGQNKNWLFLHNRFTADTGFGFFAKDGSSGHLIENNVFTIRDGSRGVWLDTADCTGLQLVGNRFDGVASAAEIADGAIELTGPGNTWSDHLDRLGLADPGFEDTLLIGWNPASSGATSVTATPLAAHSGDTGLRIEDPDTSGEGSVKSPPFPIQPGEVCVARFWGRMLEPHQDMTSIQARLLFYDSSDTPIKAATYQLPKQADWQKYSFQYTAPLGSAKVRLGFFIFGSNVGNGDIDDVELSISLIDILNGNFEDQLAWWDASTDNGLSSATGSAKHDGSNGLAINDNSTAHAASLASAKISANANYTYQVRFWSRVLAGTEAAIHLEFFDAADALVETASKTIPTNTTDWRQYVVSGDAPADADSVRVRLASGACETVTAHFDELLLTKLHPRPDTDNVPSIFEWQRSGPTPIPLENPGFESGMSGWSASGDNGMSVVSTLSPHGGSKCLRVTDNDVNANSALQTIARYDVQPGTTYLSRFWAKRLTGSNIAVYIRFLDASDTKIGEAYKSVPTSATTWTQLDFDGVAPVGATKAYLYIHSYGSGTVMADFDDFEFFAL